MCCVRCHALRRQKPNKGRTFYNYVIILFQQIKTGFLFFLLESDINILIFEIEVYKKGVFEKTINFSVSLLIGIELAIGSLVIELVFVKIYLKYI